MAKKRDSKGRFVKNKPKKDRSIRKARARISRSFRGDVKPASERTKRKARKKISGSFKS